MSNIMFQGDPEEQLKEMELPCELGMPLEELLAPREQNNRSQKPPRAQNKFILYRKHYIARARKNNPQRTAGMKARELSKEASQSWDSESNEVKRYFTIMAEVAVKRHKEMYPGYTYEPGKKKDKQVDLEESFSSSEDEFSEYLNYDQCDNLTE
ncbi:24424_t:CDS:1 [Racocetra persica]|uniref:24424_t:CDS:1 n=1 Tax=Racocetra persica TaxID=160502 RepID=A0ACA9NF35_9GLOM|nr:24424_t:CDS:1 [Racocetra persica]